MTIKNLTQKDLEAMTGAELVALHNDLAAVLGDKPVKRFGTKPDAVRRTWAKVQASNPAQQERKQAQPPARKKPAPMRTVPARVKPAGRGTNIQPTGEPVLPCREGSKQAALVDQLRRKEGATMGELLAALALSGKPWSESSVRSGFGWDVKQKGYGVRSAIGADGIERFHLVVPAGQKIPPHAPGRGA
jgi:hypothetical protein